MNKKPLNNNIGHNIKIFNNESNIWFATSEDKDREIFVSALSYEALMSGLKESLDEYYKC